MVFKTLQERLKAADTKVLSKKLGYAKEQNLLRVIRSIVEAKSLSRFLYKGYFDWLYGGSRDLLCVLCSHFELDIADEIKDANVFNEECDRYRSNYISANISTKCRLWANPVPCINLHDVEHLYFKELDEQLSIISDLIKGHYERHKDHAPHIYKIASYSVRFLGVYYLYDINGVMQKSQLL
ncbi:MAG: hypothetical protein K5978_00055 [Campylobacter sp.]|nr:hypothetical protein [Campylobacter sp.]